MGKVQIFKQVEELFGVKTALPHNEISVTETLSKIALTKGYFTIDKFLDSKETFLENYGNPLAEVKMDRVTLVIEETENKISMKFFLIIKKRKLNSKYFSQNRNIFFITLNKETKNIYSGSMIGKHRLHRKLRVNNPRDIVGKIAMMISVIPQDSKVFSVSLIMDTLKLWLEKIGFETLELDSSFNSDTLTYKIQKYLYKIKGIKAPNNIKVFLEDYPGMTFLKKTNGKLVEAYMKKNKLRGGKMRKYLHEATSVEYLRNLKSIYDLVGIDLFNVLREDNLRELCLSSVNSRMENVQDRDRIKFFNLLNQSGEYFPNSRWVLLHISEHLRFRNTLQNKYNHLFEFKFTNIRDFQYEHSDLSELVQSYRKGFYERIYSEEFVIKIQEPIMDFNGIEYFPVILTTTKEYNEESSVQNNCVRTYCEYPDRLIVSLRESSPTGNNRATIEYRYNSKFSFSRRQTLGRFNKPLDSKWDLPIEILDYRIESNRKLFDAPKLKITRVDGSQKIKLTDDLEGQVTWQLDVVNDNLPF